MILGLDILTHLKAMINLVDLAVTINNEILPAIIISRDYHRPSEIVKKNGHTTKLKHTVGSKISWGMQEKYYYPTFNEFKRTFNAKYNYVS